MAVNLSPYGGVGAQFFDNSGNVLTGGKIETYAAGTTTPQPTYTSSSGLTFHSNPIILDASGRVPSGGEIWLTDGLSYKFVLKDSNNVLIATYDNVIGINSNFVNFVNQQEIQVATAGQTVFNLTTTSYQVGTNSLSVFVDGVNQYGPGAQYAYLETDSDTVTFINGLHVGALVKFTTSQLNSSGATDASQVSFTGFNAQVGTVQDLADDNGSDWIGFEQAGTGAVAISAQDKMRQIVSVKDFGAIGDGVANDTVAIQAAFNYILPNGGTVFFPLGTYLHSANLTFAKNQKNYLIIGYGATLIPTAAVSTAIEVTGGGNRGQLVIEGLNFDHLSSTTIQKAIDINASSYVKIIRCTFSARSNAAYNAIKFNDTFWGLVDTCQFYGSGAPYYGSAIWINGICNATKIQNNQIASAVNAIYIDANVLDEMVNALRIVNNDFEAVTNAVTFNNPAIPAYTADGVLVTLNRIEAATTFLNISGALANESSHPLTSYNNYFVAGNVTNYIQNPNNQLVSIFEQTFFPNKFDNEIGGPGNFTVIASDTGSNFQIQNRNGLSTWDSAHLVLGTYHIWADTGGVLRIKNGVPSSATDGTVVGTQT
jgi:hypothetical protein